MSEEKTFRALSLTELLLRRERGYTGGAPSIAKSHHSASSTSLLGKRFLLPSGRVITVIEDTGHDSYLCDYDSPEIPLVPGMTKEEIEDGRRVEFRKSFILNYGKEWK